MEETPSFCLEWIEGLPQKNGRVIAWLTSRPEREEVNGKAEFEKLPRREYVQFMTGFDVWLDRKPKSKYFHGWKESDYKDVFRFGFEKGRFMGFLCKPDPDDEAFEMCLLVRHFVKRGMHTPKEVKKYMQKLADDLHIQDLFKNIQEDCEQYEKDQENQRTLDK